MNLGGGTIQPITDRELPHYKGGGYKENKKKIKKIRKAFNYSGKDEIALYVERNRLMTNSVIIIIIMNR